MDFFTAVSKRRSVRAFRPGSLRKQDEEKILQACNAAPSAGNLQAYEIYYVSSPPLLDALTQAAYGQEFIRQAPVSLVICAHPERARRYAERGASLYAIQDATLAAAYAQLAATSLGLATCWVGAFDEGKVTAALHLPSGQRPIIILPIGEAAEDPEEPGRRSLDGLVHRL